MSKWKLTDASAKRIMAAYLETLKDGGDPYPLLRAAVRKEEQSGFNATGEMMLWIGRNSPQHLPRLADSCSYLYESLRKRTRDFMQAFDSLSGQVEYKHYHDHSKEYQSDR